MSKIYQAPKGKGTGLSGLLLGVSVSGLLFLAIPLTQIFNEYEKQPEEIMAIEVAPPPPSAPARGTAAPARAGAGGATPGARYPAPAHLAGTTRHGPQPGHWRGPRR